MPHNFEVQPLEIDRFYTGVISQRNPLAIPIRIMGRRIIELYDAILFGNDAEISVRSTLQRRAGYSLFNSSVVGGIPLKWFAFEPVAQNGIIYPLLDTTTDIWSVPFGLAAPQPTSIYNKPSPTQSSFFAVGNYLYIGNKGFSKKWDTGNPQGLTNWGIAIASVGNAAGPNGCGTGTDVAVNGGTAWSNPGNITASDGSFAAVSLTPQSGGTPGSVGPNSPNSAITSGGGQAWVNPTSALTLNNIFAQAPLPVGTTSAYLEVTNFGFNVPAAAIITGISVAVYGFSDVSSFSAKDSSVRLIKAGSLVGADRAKFQFFPNVYNSAVPENTYGTSSDLWGTSLTPTDVNSNNFGVGLQVQQQGGIGCNVFIDYISIVVSYTIPSGQLNFSDLLQGTNFGFSIPATETISGILVEIQGFQSSNPSGSGLTVSMLKGGSTVGNAQTNVQLPGSNGFISLGGVADLWGTTWSPNDVDQIPFGISIQATSPRTGTGTWSIDFVRITIFGVGGPSVTVNAAAGFFTATQGYQYLFVYGNSNDKNISNPTPSSTSTGPFTNRLNVGVQLTASPDSQVNQIRVMRTTDTGTGAVFFEIPTSPYPNVSQTIFDSAADGALSVTSSVLANSLAFSPPPPGLRLMAWYAGRMWGAVGNLLYFSAGPDNAPMGNGNSNWPPNNVYELPTTIVKLMPIAGGNGMFVQTFNKIHIVQGITNPGFTVNVWNEDIGARQENAVDSDGSTIYIFTSDRQFLQITSQGINELSQFVSDTTDTFDPTKVSVVQHRSGSQDSRVFLSDGSSRIYPYNLMASCWEPIQTPVDRSGVNSDLGGVGAIASIEVQPGIYRFLKAGVESGQAMLYRDQSVFTDNLLQYGWGATFGNIPVADPTQLANVDSMVLRQTNAGNLPAVGILPNDIAGTFIPLATQPQFEPPEASAGPTGHRANRFYLSTGPGLWQQMMHFQLQFTFAPSSAMEEILSWGIFPNESADQQTGQIPPVQGR